MMKDRSIVIKNIYYMLSYAFTTLRESVYDDIAAESFDNIDNLFAAILARGIGVQLKRGLHQEYVNRVSDLTVMRGRINMPGTIRNKIGQHMRLTCDYDELSENNLLNQIVKSAVVLLLHNRDVKGKYKDELRKELLFFSNVEEIALAQVRWSDIRFQRNNRTYRLLIGICQLLVEGSLLSTEHGNHRLPELLDKQHMCKLYEKFILEYYAQEFGRHRGFSSKASQISWQLDDGFDELLPIMRTDVTLTYENRTLIIDAKYYERTMQTNFGRQTLRSDNLYQIFTYVKNKEIELAGTEHQVSGMLLYAKTDEERELDNVYHMSGNRISVRTLDLNQEFREIQAQLDGIIEKYFHIRRICAE